jgi:hypothetical protein
MARSTRAIGHPEAIGVLSHWAVAWMMGYVLLVVWVVPIEATPPQILLWVTAAIAAADRTVTSGEAQPQLHVP